MIDMFGRYVSIGDVVVYAVRESGAVLVKIAQVTNASEKDCHVRVIAGNHPRQFPYNTVLRVSSNVMVANGIDALGIVTRSTRR